MIILIWSPLCSRSTDTSSHQCICARGDCNAALCVALSAIQSLHSHHNCWWRFCLASIILPGRLWRLSYSSRFTSGWMFISAGFFSCIAHSQSQVLGQLVCGWPCKVHAIMNEITIIQTSIDGVLSINSTLALSEHISRSPALTLSILSRSGSEQARRGHMQDTVMLFDLPHVIFNSSTYDFTIYTGCHCLLHSHYHLLLMQ